MCQSYLCSWGPNRLCTGRHIFHWHLKVYHREDNTSSTLLMLSSEVHSCSVQLLRMMKTFADIEGARFCVCYFFEDREMLVKYGNTTRGIIPVALLVLGGNNKREHLVSEISYNRSWMTWAIRITLMQQNLLEVQQTNQESTQQWGVVSVKQFCQSSEWGLSWSWICESTQQQWVYCRTYHIKFYGGGNVCHNGGNGPGCEIN